MNRYIMIRRLRGPAFLLLVGTLALLNQADILHWGKSWPFFLILAGVLALAERAAMAAEGYPPVSYPGAPYPGAPYAAPANPAATAAQPPAQPGTSMVPASSQEIVHDPEGGQQ